MADSPQHRFGVIARVGRAHIRTLVPAAIVLIAMFVATIVLLGLYGGVLGAARYTELVQSASKFRFAAADVALATVPMVLLALVASLVWAAAVVQRASSGRTVSLVHATLVGLRRSPRAAAVIVLVFLAVTAAVVASPVLLVVGVVGLIVTRNRQFIAIAIPLGLAVVLLKRWSLALPAVWVDGCGVLAALAASRARSTWRGSGILLGAVAVTILVSLGATLVSTGSAILALALQVAVLLLVGPLPYVTMAVLYGRPEVALPTAAPKRAKVAAVVIAALLLPMIVSGGPAVADTGTGDVSFLIDAGGGPVTVGSNTFYFRVAGAHSAEPPQPTGPVTISIDGVVQSGSYLLDGSGPVSITATMTPGPHTVQGVYAGDSNFAGATQSFSFTAKYPTTTSLSAPATAVYRAAIALTATVTGATAGDVDFIAVPATGPNIDLGTATVSAGTATLNTTAPITGSYGLFANYAGTSTFLDSATLTPAPLTVGDAATQTSFTVSPASPSAAEDALTAHVTVAAPTSTLAPTGTVTVYDNSTGVVGSGSLVAGSASIGFALVPGSRSLTVSYTPDAGFGPSDSSTTQSVAKYLSSVDLTAAGTSSPVGSSVTFTATIHSGSASIGGTASLVAHQSGHSDVGLGSSTVTGGVATFTTSSLPVGSYDLVAAYDGDTQTQAGTSNTLAYAITTSSSTVSVTASPTNPAYLGTTRLTIGVTAGVTPTGSVSISRDGTPIGTYALAFDGTLQKDVPVGNVGTNTFTVQYLGDSNDNAATGSVDVTVAQLATSVTVSSDPDISVRYGDTVTYDGSVSASAGTPTGTVDLVVNGLRRGSGTLTGGHFSITPTFPIPVASPTGQNVVLEYLGDSNYAASDSSATTLTLEIGKAAVVPTLSTDPTDAPIGGTVTLKATIARATGTVDFYKTGTLLGTATMVSGVASIDLPITANSTQVEAIYSGDDNFATSDTGVQVITASRYAVTVTLSGQATVHYGDTFNLVAVVTTGAAIDHDVQFLTAGGTVLGTVAPDPSGVAVLAVCAAATCSSGVPLGTSDLSITAKYAGSSTNLEGLSSAYSYTVANDATTMTLDTPVTVIQGSAVTLKATINASTTPTGSVTFYGSHGGSDTFLGSDTLAGGVATVTVTVGGAAGNLIWPVDHIKAVYDPGGAPFDPVTQTAPITITRLGVTVDASVATPTVFALTTVTVQLTHEPGSSADFTGLVTVVADTGSSCTATVPTGSRVTTCQLSFNSVGSHSVTAHYAGDAVYLSGDSTAADASVAKTTPVLGGAAPSSAVVGIDFTVTWHQFDPLATGTVQVYADGTLWCTSALSVQSCTGQFLPASATGSRVPIVLQYSGDATYLPVENDLTTLVQGCAALDVHSTSALGTVTILTPSNCSAGGYLTGTTVTVKATPNASAAFVDWQLGGGVHASSDATTSFLVTTDSTTWVHVATFTTACYTITTETFGNGHLDFYPAPNCTSGTGSPGWTAGTSVAAYPTGDTDPLYNEPDEFYYFPEGTLATASGRVITADSSGRPYASVTVSSDITIPVAFGPVCRMVAVSAPGATTSVSGYNCFAPNQKGFTRYSTATVTATGSSASKVLSGWTINGVASGRDASLSVRLDNGSVNVVGSFVDCYSLTVKVDGAMNEFSKDIGSVTTAATPNCPDGSNRYLSGSTVTLTPKVLVDGAFFSGWDDQLGVAPAVAPRVVTITADTTLAAGFYLGSVCSRLNIFGDQSLIQFDNTGCGTGYYFDLQKQSALRSGEKDQANLWQSKYRSVLDSSVSPSEPLDVYAEVRGDTRNCFGQTSTTSGASTDLGWKAYGPLARPTSSCEIGGPIDVRVEACQTIAGNPTFIVNGQGYGVSDLPSVFNLVGADGTVQPYSMAGFQWLSSGSVLVDADNNVTADELAPGPCKDAGNAYPAGKQVLIYAVGPASGFSFQGWSADEGPLLKANPIVTTTNDTERKQTFNSTYDVTCHTISFGEGITPVGDIPYCPGSDPSANSYIAGTAIQVRALQHIGNRIINGFTKGVVAGQITEDAQTKDQFAYVYVDQDKAVAADYPTPGQSVGRGVAQGLKIVAGITAVAAPILISMAFPGVGIILATLAAGAGYASQFPGGDKVAAVFDLLNPTKVGTCVSQWAFTNASDPTGKANIGKAVKLANTVRQVANGEDVLAKPVSNLGFALGAASFGYGLYSAGIGHAQFGPETVEQLNDTTGFTTCLDQQYRAVT